MKIYMIPCICWKITLKDLKLRFPNISAIAYEQHLLERVWSSHVRVASISCNSDHKGKDHVKINT
jgi:hypothetical protein